MTGDTCQWSTGGKIPAGPGPGVLILAGHGAGDFWSGFAEVMKLFEN